MSELFHEGELEVQRRAGVAELAAKVGAGNLMPGLTEDFARFLAAQFFLVAAAPAPDGRVWASLLVGPPGFARATSAHDLLLRALPPAGDPLRAALEAGPVALGLLALTSEQRARVRVNGTARAHAEGIAVEVGEAFGNCPKYIQRRRPIAAHPAGEDDPAAATSSTVLDDAQRALVGKADTFFIASRHPERGADASHRGGQPGFARVAPDGDRITWGDYQGNSMFQTLGNLTVDDAAGLLFVDWERGTTLQVSGRARIGWDDERLATWPGAQRIVDVDVELIREQPLGMPVSFDLLEAHRLNPPPPG